MLTQTWRALSDRSFQVRYSLPVVHFRHTDYKPVQCVVLVALKATWIFTKTVSKKGDKPPKYKFLHRIGHKELQGVVLSDTDANLVVFKTALEEKDKKDKGDFVFQTPDCVVEMATKMTRVIGRVDQIDYNSLFGRTKKYNPPRWQVTVAPAGQPAMLQHSIRHKTQPVRPIHLQPGRVQSSAREKKKPKEFYFTYVPRKEPAHYTNWKQTNGVKRRFNKKKLQFLKPKAHQRYSLRLSQHGSNGGGNPLGSAYMPPAAKRSMTGSGMPKPTTSASRLNGFGQDGFDEADFTASPTSVSTGQHRANAKSPESFAGFGRSPSAVSAAESDDTEMEI